MKIELRYGDTLSQGFPHKEKTKIVGVKITTGFLWWKEVDYQWCVLAEYAGEDMEYEKVYHYKPQMYFPVLADAQAFEKQLLETMEEA